MVIAENSRGVTRMLLEYVEFRAVSTRTSLQVPTEYLAGSRTRTAKSKIFPQIFRRQLNVRPSLATCRRAEGIAHPTNFPQ